MNLLIHFNILKRLYIIVEFSPVHHGLWGGSLHKEFPNFELTIGRLYVYGAWR